MGSERNNILKRSLKRVARWYGCELLGPSRAYLTQRSLAGLLRKEDINLILDIGANAGQFAEELVDFGYAGRIISFEPLSAAHAQLRAKAKSYPKWTIAERTAIGAENGSLEIHVSDNSVSSSILDMLPSHLRSAPESAYVSTETVPIHRLDDLIVPAQQDNILLKIDVQGYERQVLEGAPNLISQTRAIVTEMSLLPLYESQLLAPELWGLLVEKGFEPWSLEPGFRDPSTGRMLQFDGFFFRRDGTP